ncbi:MAG: tetratricopeptide repeat protein [Nitrospiria bacterium]
MRISRNHKRSTCLYVLILTLQFGCSLNGFIRVVAKHDAIEKTPDRLTALSRRIASLQNQAIISKDGEALMRYRLFLERHKDADPRLRAAALKRTGDLSMKAAHRQFLDQMESYEKHPQGPPPLVNYDEAISAYGELLRTAPDFAQKDQVLYALSRAYSETGLGAQAIPLLKTIASEFPESPHRLEAHFRLGEFYFDRSNYARAAEAYDQAASLEDPFFQDKANYKLAWSFFNLKDYSKAIDRFLAVIDRETVNTSVFAPEEGSLVWEALTYVASAFRALGGPSQVSAYFKNKGSRPYEKDLYLMMGNQYVGLKSPQRGIETYRTFIASHPDDPMAPFFASYIAETYQKLGDRSAADAARIALVEDYGFDSPWYLKNNRKSRAPSRPLIKSELHRLGLSAHAAAQKDHRTKDYLGAAKWYRRYLSEFSKDPEAQEVHYLLGEALMNVKDFAGAGAAYEAAAYQYPNKVKGRKAAYAAVVAYEKLKTPEGSQSFLKASEQFAQHFPRDGHAPTVLLKAGELLFSSGRYAEAAVVFENIMADFPTHTILPAAAKLSGHSYMKSEIYHQAQQAYGKALSLTPPAQKEERGALSKLLATATFKEALQMKEADRLSAAADRFQALVDSHPESPLSPDALFQAAALHESLEAPESAIVLYHRLSNDYPTSDLSGEAYQNAGLLYEQLGSRSLAAADFVSAAERTDDEGQAQNLLLSAALHYKAEEAWRRVVSTYLTFIRRFSKHTHIPKALFEMAEARRKEGRDDAAEKLYQAVIDKGPKTDFYAPARFQLAERRFAQFQSIRLKTPLSKSLSKKTQALKAVVDLYTRTLKTGQADLVTGSAFRLGEAFESFKTALLEAERPEGLNEEQLEEYLFQLEEKAYPFEEKAIRAYESNVKRAQHTAGFFNDWVKKSYDRLAALRPVLYRRKERSERIITQIDPNVLSAAIQKDTRISQSVDAIQKKALVRR